MNVNERYQRKHVKRMYKALFGPNRSYATYGEIADKVVELKKENMRLNKLVEKLQAESLRPVRMVCSNSINLK